MSKIDYSLKSKVLRSDLPKLANQISRAFYARYELETNGLIVRSDIDFDTAMNLRCFLLQKYPIEYSEAEKLNRSHYKKVARIRSRIAYMLRSCSRVVFVTLTFTDDILKSTSAETRRRYVQRFLSENCGGIYVANIDFGKRNHREHYHAVISGWVDMDFWNDNYGFASCETVSSSLTTKSIPKRYAKLPPEEQQRLMLLDDEKRLSKYVAKLSNHAIKETTKRSVLLYSRFKEQSRPFLTPCDDFLFDYE